MASQLNCFKCRLIIRTKQQKVDCSNCKNWFHRVLCSGISTQDWKENSAALKTGFLCSACSSSTQQTGVSFSSSLNASVFHGFSTVVFDPLMSANDSLLTTSFSTSVLHDFSNLAILVWLFTGNLHVIETETPPVADFNAAVSNANF